MKFRVATVFVLPLLLGLVLPLELLGQAGTAPPEGLRQNRPTAHALIGARVVVKPGVVHDQATVLIRDGLIEAVGPKVAIPADARVWDLRGRTLYPGLIDAFSEPGPPAPKQDSEEEKEEDHDHDANPAAKQPHQDADGYWNPMVTPEYRASEYFRLDKKKAAAYRQQGITTRLMVPTAQLLKGSSALVTTAERPLGETLVADQVAQHIRISPPSADRDHYPASPMGAYTLVRQAFYDTAWYRRAWQAHRDQPGVPRPERNVALAALQDHLDRQGLFIIDCPDEIFALRGDALAKEFQLKALIRGNGREYRRLAALKAMNRPVLVPIRFPAAPDVRTPDAAAEVSYERLMHWSLGPENPGRIAKAGIPFAITTDRLEKPEQFLPAFRKAVERGLPAEAALAALTVTPAELLGVSSRLGSIEPGKLAHVAITDGDLFAEKTRMVGVWIGSGFYDTIFLPVYTIQGEWTFQDPLDETRTLKLTLSGKLDKLAGKLIAGDAKYDLEEAAFGEPRITGLVDAEPLWKQAGKVRLQGVLLDQTLHITGAWPDGKMLNWTATRTAVASETEPADDAEQPGEKKEGDEKKKAKKPLGPAPFDVVYPLCGFGRPAPPEQPALVLFKNATLWTGTTAAPLDNGSVLVERGKIKAIGRNLTVPAGTLEVDLAGKHLSPGLIDCHSHSATDGGINEATQSITAEVRIGDFIDSDDINIYRQLAGGVTTINVLHGSANTIGGQNQVVKLRWSQLPSEMKFAGAPQGIKFALGENVKQANWGEKFTTRYPQTRLGVEQVLRDAFRAAQDYAQTWEAFRAGKHTGLPPRVDLEQEALVEVLSGRRLIHCHSYRQDEILMLLKVCDDHKVRVATLQHILEGYKVADAIAKHGAGGSSFSDWWAYKFEVYDAIPQNGAILHNAGVVVSFNSDSAELARRLNIEAAKAIKYGNVPELQAFQFVTLNPAKQLQIDRWVGSLEVGKDADLAVWSGPPLSSLSHCVQTWIDGKKYFDRAEDEAARVDLNRRREVLIQRVLASGEEPAEDPPADKLRWPREDTYCGHLHHHGHDHQH